MGYCKSQRHYDWIKKQGKYNFRMGSDRGALVLDPKAVSARYLLLHSEEEDICELWEITSEGPKVYAKTDLESSGYPNPKHANYLIFDVVKSENEVFTKADNFKCSIAEPWTARPLHSSIIGGRNYTIEVSHPHKVRDSIRHFICSYFFFFLFRVL